MSPKKSDAATDDAGQPAVILIDAAADKLHAGWFDRTDAKAARRLAKKHKCHVYAGDQAALDELSRRIERGRIAGEELSLASVADAAVADELRQLVKPVPDGDDADNAAADDDLPTLVSDLAEAEADGLGVLGAIERGEKLDVGSDGLPNGSSDVASGQAADDGNDKQAATDLWAALKVGDLVLTADLDKKGEPDAWFEALIVRVTPDAFILRFRDFPRDGIVARSRRHVALLHPAP